jgi:hypothetical protein
MKNLRITTILLVLGWLSTNILSAQNLDFTKIPAKVDFNKKLQIWDGFGVNYVETSQTFDYQKWPQDYGSFSFLSQKSKNEIIDLIFGDDGLQPQIIKMFLDPLHQHERNGIFDHETTTGSMRYLVRRGLDKTRSRGDDLSIITTMYGPPGFMTLQRKIRGRDLNPEYKDDMVNYMVDWVKFLKEKEKFPVKYLSLHNEGESWLRWPLHGGYESMDITGHDYNMFWSPEFTAELIAHTRTALDKAGLHDVGVTNGEPTNWYRFAAWGFADAIADNPAALNALGLITSHGFYVGNIEARRWYGPHSNRGISLLQQLRPELKSWNTSTAWDVKNEDIIIDNKKVRQFTTNAHFIFEIYSSIYESNVNGLIPWAFIQNATEWIRPDPNPGCAIRVYDDGTWEIRKGYYYYKQVTQAGRSGMHVVQTSALDSELAVIAFSGEGTKHPDAFVLLNTGRGDLEVAIDLKGARNKSFQAYRTTGSDINEYGDTASYNVNVGDNYSNIGQFELLDGKIIYIAPANSVTTFLGL